MTHVANLVFLFGVVVGFPVGYYFCKFKFRKEIKNG